MSSVDKKVDGQTFQPMSNIVARPNTVHRLGLDHRTFVFFRFSSLSVKAKNLIRLLVDCNKNNIASKEISFVSYGTISYFQRISYCFAPFTVGGEEILNIIQSKQSKEWINTLKWGCHAVAMFPTCKGRNKGENFGEGIKI